MEGFSRIVSEKPQGLSPYLLIRTTFGLGGLEHVDMHTSLASQAHSMHL